MTRGLSFRSAIGILWLFILFAVAFLAPWLESVYKFFCGNLQPTNLSPTCKIPTFWCEVISYVRSFFSIWAFLFVILLTKPIWTPGLMYLVFSSAPRRVIARKDALKDLLSFQTKENDFVKAMEKIIKNIQADRSLFIGIRGTWGSGKSRVLRTWAEHIECSDDIAVVWYDVWENDTVDDLHWSIIMAVLSNPKVLFRSIGVYPLRLLFYMIRWHQWMPEGLRWRLEAFNRMQIDGYIKPVPLRFQNIFAKIVLRATRDSQCFGKKLKIVIVLDEIDRARSGTVQSAMILARRALEFPGMIVILPYVEEQMRYKVFNPLTATSLDLQETMLAVLMDVYLNKSNQNLESLLQQGHLWLSDTSQQHDGSDTTKTSSVTGGHNYYKQSERALTMGLLRFYASLSGKEYHLITKLFEEKFIAMTFSPGQFTFADLPELAYKGDVVGPLWIGFCKGLFGDHEGVNINLSESKLVSAINHMRNVYNFDEVIESLRLAEGFILEFLQICSDLNLQKWLKGDDSKDNRKHFLLSLVLFVAGSRVLATLHKNKTNKSLGR